MKNVTFSPEEKIEMFDQIATLYFNQNFGHVTKADIDLLMFKFYLEALIEKHRNPDNTIDYNKCSDYQISKDLCITPQKVRVLKIKKQLLYPEEFSWQEALAGLLKNARLDDNKIILSIPDPNLYLEIENFIEENGFYIEKTLNGKLLKMRIEYFIALAIEAGENEDNKQKIIKQIKKNLKEHQKDERKFDEKNIGKSLIELGVNATTILANISSSISPEQCLLNNAIKFLKEALPLENE